MSPFIVADVGNSRLKWGLCDAREVRFSASLPLDDPTTWCSQLEAWAGSLPGGPASERWIIAGVNPDGVQKLVDWLGDRTAGSVQLVANASLQLVVDVDRPEQVGVDRLLNAIALNSVRPPGQPAVIADAGSAVTVDWVDEEGVFRGGAILPGLRLMAQALHRYTAKLPLVRWNEPGVSMPGKNTESAIIAGIQGAVCGAIERLTEKLAARSETRPVLYLTGGDAPLLVPLLPCAWKPWPLMTLEGLRLTALKLV